MIHYVLVCVEPERILDCVMFHVGVEKDIAPVLRAVGSSYIHGVGLGFQFSTGTLHTHPFVTGYEPPVKSIEDFEPPVTFGPKQQGLWCSWGCYDDR